VLYVRDHEAALTAMRDAHRRNVPIVLEVNAPHDEIAVSYPWLAPVLPRLERSFAHRLRLADRIIVVAEGMKRFLEDRYRLHASVVPNGADPERFRPDACRLRPARPYAVFVGVLARWQGLETILDAAARPEWPSGLDLIVAGDGVMRERVEAAAAAAEHVQFLGPVPFADVPSLLAGASASLVATTASRSFAAPETLSEPGWAKPGFSPVKLYESMASGVPLVVTDVPGQAEVVRAAGAGLVVPAADAEAMASAVADLVRDPEKARSMGERGRIAVLREHSWQARAAATEAVIVEAMDARRAVGA
jgi:glycosyltransferase involved in cell wall biosynthesis